MPSDAVAERATTLAERALAGVRQGIDAFRSVVAAAEEEVRGEVLRRAGADNFREEQALVELGPFALGRIDPGRFASLMGVAETELAPESIDVLAKADAILAGFARSSKHLVEVEPGGDLRDVVKDALAHLGQAFGAARAVEIARAGMFDLVEHGYLLGPLAFRLWNRSERQLAPPLVVTLRGEDCLPAGLGEFLDGEVKIILVAEGPTTPAPLARLITPGTFVMQTEDPADLARLVETRHPGVALLFDAEREGQACFLHDPDAGAAPWQRLEVRRVPSDADVGRGRRTPAWLEDVVHLRTLAERPAAVEAAAASADSPVDAASSAGDSTATPAEPADQLAAWLLAGAGPDA